MSLPTTTTSPHFLAGSFLVFENDDTLKSAFYECMQLKETHSSRRALKSLLTFLDQKYPGPAFFASTGKRLNKIADRWLEKPWWAGRVYWGKDHQHLELSEAIEGAELTWPDDEKTLRWGVKQLLVWLKPHAEGFFKMRSELAQGVEKEKEKEDEDEDEDGRAEKKQKTAPEKGGLVIRTRASGIERLADLQL